jgi:hypothetical protein
VEYVNDGTPAYRLGDVGDVGTARKNTSGARQRTEKTAKP